MANDEKGNLEVQVDRIELRGRALSKLRAEKAKSQILANGQVQDRAGLDSGVSGAPVTKRGDYALRFYLDGEGTSNLLCLIPGHECPQWHHNATHRYTFASPEEAEAFLGTLRGEWPEEFTAQDIRVVHVLPPSPESYLEVSYL